MAPTTTREGGEASGGQSRARRRRRRRTPARSSTPTVTTRPRVGESEATPSSQRGKRKRARAAKDRSRKGRRARTADKGHEEGEGGSRKNTSEDEEEEEVAAAASASPATEQGPSSEASSAVSSPLRLPYIPRVVKGHHSDGSEILQPCIDIDPAVVNAYEHLRDKYLAKKERQLKLPTLDQRVPRSCLVDHKLIHVRESATKTVLQVAKVVLGLTSYVDGKLLRRASGFLVEWDKATKVGTVLTSALLIRSKATDVDEWLGTDEYSPDAEIQVQLLDKESTIVPAILLNFNKQYNLALFKVTMDLPSKVKIPPFSEVECSQEVFVIGRNKDLYLNIDHGTVLYESPSSFQRHHYMFIACGINEFGIGGPVVDYNGEVAGMANRPDMAFVPSSIIIKCLRMWKKYDCIPRLHFGMKFSAIKFLDPARAELISRKCNIDAGLIVKQVAEGSDAERKGVRIGDIIECWNGEYISTTVDLENMLLRICEEHLDKGNAVDSNVDLQVDIFHTRKDSRCTIQLAVNMYNNVEVVSRGTHPVSPKDYVLVSDDNMSAVKFAAEH
ncbi:hypothetical protein ACP70R_048435 [Stipagrostis hirtigluma subsp. patula]